MKCMLSGLWIMFFILVHSFSAQAATHYVAVSGVDTNPGTQAQPWRTAQKCANSMSAGDTCIISAGNYDESLAIGIGGIDAAHPTVFISVDGQAVMRSITIKASHTRVDGFEITQPNGSSGIVALTLQRVNASTAVKDVLVQNCSIHNTVFSQYAIAPYLEPYPERVTLKNNIVSSIDGPAMIVAGSYWTIERNTFKDIHSDIAYYSGDHHTIQDNVFSFVREGSEGHHADFMQTAGSSLTDCIFQRNKFMYGALVQLGNFNNTSACEMNRNIWRNNLMYAITNPLNYAGCNSKWQNNTFVNVAEATGAHPVTGSTGQVTDTVEFSNNLFIGNATEGDALHGGWYDAFSQLTDNNNMVSGWPSGNFAPLNTFNTDRGNINGGDPKLKNIPISAYPIEGQGMIGWDMEGWSVNTLMESIWLPGPGTGINGTMWYSDDKVAQWTYGASWAYHPGGQDWTQYYAAHTADGTAPLVYNNFTPIAGRSYAISMRAQDFAIAAGSITPSLGGATGVPCSSTTALYSGWCPAQTLTAVNGNPLAIIPSADFRNGLWQVTVQWMPQAREYSFSTDIKHEGKQSLHLTALAKGSTITSDASSGLSSSFMHVRAWVYLVSGSIKVYLTNTGVIQDIGNTVTTGAWIQLSNDVTANLKDAIVFEATADNTEVYIDDVSETLRFMSPSTIQYVPAQKNALAVGSQVSINGDGICRTVTENNAATHTITFSPALSVAPLDWSWIEAWGNNTSCVPDFTPRVDSPAKGTNLSLQFTDDILGSRRSGWNMGAYEFIQGGSGDVSGDGRVTMYDAAQVLKYTVGGTLTPAQQTQADINSDTTVDTADAAAIARRALGIN